MNTNITTPNNTTHATGPKTEDGKRIAARNATTHGLFARDVVLPHLGEDPAGYEVLLAELAKQLAPKNLLEQHYVEKIAAASWRLRRLQRWQAQLFEDPDITEDEALNKLDRVMRHETALHRQIDSSVKMLARELPKLFSDRAHQKALYEMGATDAYCSHNPSTQMRVAALEQDILDCPLTPPGLDLTRLDAAPVSPSTPPNCQNELPEEQEEQTDDQWEPEKCQNEPTAPVSSATMTTFPLPVRKFGASHNAPKNLPHPLPELGEGRRLAAGVRARER